MSLNPDVLRDIISSQGTSHKESAQSFIFYCPFCNKPKLYIRKSNGQFKCFKCATDKGFQGRAEYALTELFNIPVSELKDRLYGEKFQAKKLLKLSLKDFYDLEDLDEIEIEEDLPILEYPSHFIGPEDDKYLEALKYLKTRDIDLSLALEYGIKYDPIKKRVIFPIEHDYNLVGWQGRLTWSGVFTDKTTGKEVTIPKSLNNKDLEKEKVIMFYDRIKEAGHAVVTEGPVDAIKAHLCGGNVATLGKGITEEQIDLLCKATDKIYLALDPDAARDIDRVCRKVISRANIYVMETPKGREDLGKSTYEEVLEEFHKAKKYSGQFFMYLKNNFLSYKDF